MPISDNPPFRPRNYDPDFWPELPEKDGSFAGFVILPTDVDLRIAALHAASRCQEGAVGRPSWEATDRVIARAIVFERYLRGETRYDD